MQYSMLVVRAGVRLGAWSVMGLALGAALPAGAASSALAAALELAGRDPAAAHEALAALRREAITAGALAERLAVDEADCRVLSDSDARQARQVATAGMAAASGPEAAAARLPLLRLRACAAGVLLDQGQTVAGNAELDEIVAATQSQPALAPARAMALLERGLHRSRRGELVPGQQDLLGACQALETLKLPRDLELCRWHLANHYKRMGDADEALQLMTRLLEDARRRGATADAGVYVFGVAQVHYERGDWPRAQAAFEEAVATAEAAHDQSGIAYAEHGLGHALLQLGRAQPALVHARRAITLLQDPPDPVQLMRTTVLEAMALSAFGRGEEAASRLDSVERSVRDTGDDLLLGDWLKTRAQADAQLGRWREAYQALQAWKTTDQRVQAQRLSEQTARLRLQFNRERDAAEVAALRRTNAQERQLVRTQRLALGLFVLLLLGVLGLALQKIRQGRRLHRLALLDELTGLPNRRAIRGRLQEALRLAQRTKRPLAVLMLDVDHFKRINDTHGHPVGDEVLGHLARLLSAGVRLHDQVGRLGGEEFMVLLPDAGRAQAETIAERMRHAVATTPCATAAGPLAITVSVGVACSGEDDADALVERADRALYQAKSAGRNTVCCSEPAVRQGAAG